MKIFSSVLLLIFAMVSLRLAFDYARPALPWLCLMSAVMAGLWLYVAWRRSRW